MNAPKPNFTLKDEIRAYWSDRASTFDHSASHRIEDRYGMPEWRRLLCDALNLAPGETLAGWQALDIACGTGEVSRVLTGMGAEVTGIDFSEPMLAIARVKLAGRPWRGMLVDAEALHPVRDHSFDLAVTRHLAWTLTDPAAAYAEWRRVLRAEGRLLVVDGNWSADRGALPRLRCWIADRLERGSARSEADRSRHEDIRTALAYSKGLTLEQLQVDLRAAGFTKIRPLSVSRLYGAGMRGASLADRLRQTAEHRFALVAS